MDKKPDFQWNNFGNRVLWLGNLLSRLDKSYEKAPVLLQANYDAHRDAIAEIVQWQNQIMTSRPLETFLSSRSLHPLQPEQLRIVAVVAFRQSLMFYCDTALMNIARIASLKRTFDDIVKNRSAAVRLFESGVLEASSISAHSFLKLHSGLSSFLLGETATIIDTPKAKPAEPTEKPAPDIPDAARSIIDKASLPDYVKSLPEMTPMDMAKVIHREGYIGQEQAVKSVCLMAWRHLNRLKKVFVEGVDCRDLPPKGNALLLGSSGCGKTFLVELLFSKIISLPVVICDVSSFVETGYVGAHVSSIFKRLIQVADNNVEKAGVGVVCLDEFDKICSSHSAARFAGQGTTKDLKLAVQQELLKILEGSEVTYDLDYRSSGDKQVINTKHIGIIGCGAFSGLKSMLQKQGKAIGFGTQDKSQIDLNVEIQRASSFESYGIIPELYGRFSSLVSFDDLTKDELKAILEKNTIRQYERELSLNGLGLQVHPDVYDHIVEQCIERQTGARGLQTALVSHLEDALFNAYSNHNSQGVRLFVDGGQIGWEVQKRRVKREVKTKEAEKEALLLASG